VVSRETLRTPEASVSLEKGGLQALKAMRAAIGRPVLKKDVSGFHAVDDLAVSDLLGLHGLFPQYFTERASAERESVVIAEEVGH